MFTLLLEGDPILTEPSTDYDFSESFDPEKLVHDMRITMLWHRGMGLAAPQVGILKNLFVMDHHGHQIACFNPQVVEVSNDRSHLEEGCLSFPDLFLKIWRPNSVVLRY